MFVMSNNLLVFAGSTMDGAVNNSECQCMRVWCVNGEAYRTHCRV